MRNLRRATRPSGSAVASCDDHLPAAMRAVTSPVDGDDNDTHVVVRRLGDDSDVPCQVLRGARRHLASWVLIPQAVLR